MKVKTRPYGEIEVSEQQKLYFPEGIIGFEGVSNYYLLDSKEGPFYWLQAAEHPDIAFLLVDPRLFMGGYVLRVKEAELEALEIKTGEDILDFAIVTVPEDPAKISANLMGPIVINRKTRVARQVISDKDEYKVKHYILEEMRKENTTLAETC